MRNPKEMLHALLAKMGSGEVGVSADELKELITIQLDKAGSLPNRIGVDKKMRISHLRLIGELNSTDFRFIREMPRLEVLDLVHARIVTGGSYYIKQLYCQTEDDVIGLYLFHRNPTLRVISFPKDVTSVRPLAFRRCKALSVIHFSEALERIEDRAFSYCDALETVQFPAALRDIRSRAFSHCKNLKTVSFSDSLVRIGEFAFGDCSSLQTIHFGVSLQTIENLAFAHTAITSVAFPRSLQEIGASIFEGCRSLTSIHVSSEIPPQAEPESFSGLNLKHCTLYVPKGTKNNYWLANGWEKFEHIVEE